MPSRTARRRTFANSSANEVNEREEKSRKKVLSAIVPKSQWSHSLPIMDVCYSSRRVQQAWKSQSHASK